MIIINSDIDESAFDQENDEIANEVANFVNEHKAFLTEVLNLLCHTDKERGSGDHIHSGRANSNSVAITQTERNRHVANESQQANHLVSSINMPNAIADNVMQHISPTAATHADWLVG